MQAMKTRDAKALREAVMRYEEEMWPRGAETVRVTVETAKQSQSLEGLRKSSYFTKDLSDRIA